MGLSRKFAALILVLMLLILLPAICLPLANAASPSTCHQHRGSMPGHNCCSSTPHGPAVLQVTLHETALEVVSLAAADCASLIRHAASVRPSHVITFSSPPPSVLRI